MARPVPLLCIAAFLFSPCGLRCQSAQSVPTPAPGSERIIDVQAAQRIKVREHGFRAYQVPLFPFLIIGRGMEKGFLAVDKSHALDRARYYVTERERGFKPLFGGLGIGTGFALGVEYYYNDFLRPGGRLDVPIRVSSLLYQDYGFNVSVPLGSGGRTFVDSGVHYRVRTQDDFFGLGNESRVGDRTTYMLRSGDALLGPRFELPRGLRLTMQFGYHSTSVSDGKDARFPVITARFTPDRVPGLRDGARQWTGEAALAHDTRDVPGRPRHGGYERLEAAWHQTADAKDFGFWHYQAEAERYVPLWSRNRILALRFLGITNLARGGSAVPFFEQAILGGSSTLRGFREFRFYDLSGAILAAEYRYNLNAFVDMVMFLDQGQVGRRLGDLNWGRFRTGYGGGFRFLNQGGTPFKILFGRSNEGTRIYFSLGGTF